MPDADEVEEDWNRALDAAQGALSAIGETSPVGRPPPEDLAREAQKVREERKWLAGSRGVFRRLFPQGRSTT